MSLKKTFSFSLLILLQISCISYSHPDCNGDRVIDQFLYMCSSYYSNSLKREANVADGSGILFPLFPREGSNTGGDESVLRTQPGLGLGSQDYQAPFPIHQPQNSPQYTSFVVPLQDLPNGPRRRGSMRMPSSANVQNDPEDFTSFNNWYLNPVYSDLDWPSTIERWTRKSFIKDEIWRFVETKCCVKGCSFPKDYLELDKRVNICGMR